MLPITVKTSFGFGTTRAGSAEARLAGEREEDPASADREGGTCHVCTSLCMQPLHRLPGIPTNFFVVALFWLVCGRVHVIWYFGGDWDKNRTRRLTLSRRRRQRRFFFLAVLALYPYRFLCGNQVGRCIADLVQGTRRTCVDDGQRDRKSADEASGENVERSGNDSIVANVVNVGAIGESGLLEALWNAP